MRKISLILSAGTLSLLNSGARAETGGFDAASAQHLFAPHPAFVAVLALAGIACLLLMARTPLGDTVGGAVKWRRLPSFWPSRRTTFAILALVSITGSMGIA